MKITLTVLCFVPNQQVSSRPGANMKTIGKKAMYLIPEMATRLGTVPGRRLGGYCKIPLPWRHVRLDRVRLQG